MELSRLCLHCGSKRFLPFMHFLIAVVSQIVLYISWSLYHASKITIPQYLIDSPILDAFNDENVKVVQIISASVGFVIVADMILEVCIYYFTWGYRANLREPSAGSDSESWLSDRLLDDMKDWSIRFLCTLAIIVQPLVLLSLTSDEDKIIYAFGLRTFRYTMIVSAGSMSITETIDRTWRQYVISFSLNAAYCLGELLYYFYSFRESSAQIVNVLSFIKAFRTTALALIIFRILCFLALIIKYKLKSGELRVRRLSIKEWRFTIYLGFMAVLTITILSLGGQYGFDFYRTNARSQIVFNALFIMLAVILSLFSLARSRYEVVRAQSIAFYAERKVARAVNSPLREAMEEVDELIRKEQASRSADEVRLQSLLKVALACHTAVDILEEDINRLERDDLERVRDSNPDDATSGKSHQPLIRRNRSRDNDGNKEIEINGRLEDVTAGEGRIVDQEEGEQEKDSSEDFIGVHRRSHEERRHQNRPQREVRLSNHIDSGDNDADGNDNGNDHDAYHAEMTSARSKRSKLSTLSRGTRLSNAVSTITQETTKPRLELNMENIIQSLLSCDDGDVDPAVDSCMMGNIPQWLPQYHYQHDDENTTSSGKQKEDSKSESEQEENPTTLEHDHVPPVPTEDGERIGPSIAAPPLAIPIDELAIDRVGQIEQHEDDEDDSSSMCQQSLFAMKNQHSTPATIVTSTPPGGSLSTVSKTALHTDRYVVPGGISEYCMGNYEVAAETLLRELEHTEGGRLWNQKDLQVWPSDLRLWLCASLNRLGKRKEAEAVLNHVAKARGGSADKSLGRSQVAQRQFIGLLMSFYAREKSLEEVLVFIARQRESDVDDHHGFKFFGYFYLGLYYDSMGDYSMSGMLLAYPLESQRFSPQDVWHTISLMLARRCAISGGTEARQKSGQERLSTTSRSQQSQELITDQQCVEVTPSTPPGGSLSTVSKTALHTDRYVVPGGISEYCMGNYEVAAETLLRELEHTEGGRLWNQKDLQVWPSDLRLWLCASLNRLGKRKEAEAVLNHVAKARGGSADKSLGRGQVAQRQFIGLLMSFYAREKSLEEVLVFIARQRESDVDDHHGFKFFGYFYLGLYYDSMGDYSMSEVFLSYPVKSDRFSPQDVWHTISLLLARRCIIAGSGTDTEK